MPSPPMPRPARGLSVVLAAALTLLAVAPATSAAGGLSLKVGELGLEVPSTGIRLLDGLHLELRSPLTFVPDEGPGDPSGIDAILPPSVGPAADSGAPRGIEWAPTGGQAGAAEGGGTVAPIGDQSVAALGAMVLFVLVAALLVLAVAAWAGRRRRRRLERDAEKLQAALLHERLRADVAVARHAARAAQQPAKPAEVSPPARTAVVRKGPAPA